MLPTVVIVLVVVFSIGLLIGVTSMSSKVRDLETKIAETQITDEVFTDRVYSDLNFQINLLRCKVFSVPNWKNWGLSEHITNDQRRRLRRLGSQLIRIKDKDEDHPDSVEGQ